MGHRLVPTVGAVNVRLVMSGAVVAWCAILGIYRAHLNAVIVYVIAVWMVQVAIVKIVCVAIVFDSGVAAIRAVLVAMGA